MDKVIVTKQKFKRELNDQRDKNGLEIIHVNWFWIIYPMDYNWFWIVNPILGYVSLFHQNI